MFVYLFVQFIPHLPHQNRLKVWFISWAEPNKHKVLQNRTGKKSDDQAQDAQFTGTSSHVRLLIVTSQSKAWQKSSVFEAQNYRRSQRALMSSGREQPLVALCKPVFGTADPLVPHFVPDLGVKMSNNSCTAEPPQSRCVWRLSLRTTNIVSISRSGGSQTRMGLIHKALQKNYHHSYIYLAQIRQVYIILNITTPQKQTHT